ncbi:MAG: hypothetical protein IPO08_24160 [Xanthomonadales bacterium]|nr:hypothetical protein [Xanthomonadales bacterium]
MKTMAKPQRRSAVLRRHEARQTASNRTRAKTIAFAIVTLIGMALVFAAGAQREQAAWAEAEFIGYPPGEGPAQGDAKAKPEMSLHGLAFGLAHKSENALSCMEQGLNPGCQ